MSADVLDVDEWAEPATLEDRVEELEALVAELSAALAAKRKAEEPPPLKYQTLPEFVDWLRSWYRRDAFGGYELNWCPDWWKHDEVVLRLDVLWRSFELLRHEAGTGLSTWLRDHVDVHLPRLMAPDGPLERCSMEGHADDPLPPLPANPPPAGWWTPEDSGVKPAVTKAAA